MRDLCESPAERAAPPIFRIRKMSGTCRVMFQGIFKMNMLPEPGGARSGIRRETCGPESRVLLGGDFRSQHSSEKGGCGRDDVFSAACYDRF